MPNSAIRGARSIGCVSGNSRLGSSSSKTFDSWDAIPRAATENEIRLIGLIKEYSAGREDARILDLIFELLYDETSPNVMDADACRSALHWAVLHGQTQLVRALLEAGALTNTFAKDGYSPLMVAVRKGSLEVVELLLEEGARTDLINTLTGAGPLMLACIFANSELVQLLLDRRALPDVTWSGPHGQVTPLTAAATKVCEPKPMAEQYLQVVEMLLAAGACPDVIVHQETGETLLHNAVARNQPGLVRALLRAQANPDVPLKDGVTPLMTAVRLSSCELVEALIDGGALVEAKNEFNGKTAFSMACNLGNLELVQLLLARGAGVGTRWFNPNDFNAPILVVACKCDDSLGRFLSFNRIASNGSGISPGATPPAVSPGPYGGPYVPSGAGSGRITPTTSCSGGAGLWPGSARGAGGTKVYLDIVRVLLQGGADPNTQGSKNGVTPLLIAVENNHLGLLRLLLEAKANPDLPDTSGCTPLIAACTEGCAEAAKILLDFGARVNMQRRDGWTALMGAVLNRSASLVEALLAAGAEVNVRVPPGELLRMESTPLMAACGEGALEVARVLLAHGADPNLTNAAGQGALWCGCRGGHPEGVQLLLEAGAGAGLQHPKDQATPSALVQAAFSGNCHCVEMVVEAGAQVDEYDNSLCSDGGHLAGGRFTPLAAACSRGRRGTAELLLRRGADPNVAWVLDDRAGQVELRPLQAVLARPWGSDEGAEAECAALVELLLAHGASPANCEPGAHTALEIAAREGRAGALEVLLKRGAQSNLVDKDGATPLILAALKGSVACVKLLLGAGANANATTQVGVSPLVAAIGAFATGDGNLELIQALLDAGANPNAPFFEEDTILTAAVDGGNPALVSVLLAAGADPEKPNTAGALPLQLAVSKGHSELVRLLLQAGASPQLPNLDWSAMRFHQKGRHDILELLARAGVAVPPPPPSETAGRGTRSSSSSGNASISGRRLQPRASMGAVDGTGGGTAGTGGASGRTSGGLVRRRSSQGGVGALGGAYSNGGGGGGSLRRRSSQGGNTRTSGTGRISASGSGGTARLNGGGGSWNGSLSGGRMSGSGQDAAFLSSPTGSANGLGGGSGGKSLRPPPPPLQIGRTDSISCFDDTPGTLGSGSGTDSMSVSSSSAPPTVTLMRSPAGGHGLSQFSPTGTAVGYGVVANGGGSRSSSSNGTASLLSGSPLLLARSGRTDPAAMSSTAATIGLLKA